MKIAIEHLEFEELLTFLRIQAEDSFPDLKDEHRLNMLAMKWYIHAEFSTCRDEDNRLVGIIAFYANLPKNGIAYIPHIYLSGEYRGTGVFKELLLHVKEYVRAKGFKYLRLEVQRNNNRAQRAYINNGFQIDEDASENSFYMRCEI